MHGRFGQEVQVVSGENGNIQGSVGMVLGAVCNKQSGSLWMDLGS